VNVPSFEFLAFAAVISVAINVGRGEFWRKLVLLVANIAFLTTFAREGIAYLPFFVFVSLGFVLVRLLQVRQSKALFVTGIVGLVTAFCWIKRYSFVPTSFDVPFLYVTIGLSYVFFRIVHLAIDAQERALPVRVGIVSYVNYTLNFTSLVAGPIQLYDDYHRSEGAEPLPLDLRSCSVALGRIILGFFKVAIVSPVLAAGQDRAIVQLSIAQPTFERAADLAVVIATFAVFLYANFSGYTDFVIGVARFLRIELPENFNHPFDARGFIELWSRWHITLSQWLKTYVYSPLLLALLRRFPERTFEPYLAVFAYFVTFFLVGVWHGQTQMFLFFGVLQGFGVSVNKLYQIIMTKRLGRVRYRALNAQPLYVAALRGLTITWFAFTLIWFWASWQQLRGLASEAGPVAVIAGLALLYVGVTAALVVVTACETRFRSVVSTHAFASARPYVQTAWFATLAVILISATVVLNAPAPRIVYKGF